MRTVCTDCRSRISWGASEWCNKCKQKNLTFAPRNCEKCGVEFRIARSTNQRFCSHKCNPGRGAQPVGGETLRRITFMKDVLACNPYVTLQQFGDVFHITRERVRQIQIVGGVTKIRGGLVEHTKPRCSDCNNRIEFGNSGGRCRPCRIINNQRHFICEVCGKDFIRQPGEVARAKRDGGRVRWCGHKCGGVYLGVNYGFAIHGKGGRHRVEPITKTCEHCGQDYQAKNKKQRTKQRYCSLTCFGSSRRKVGVSNA